MNEMGIKKDAAGTANASDMIGKNATKDIIAHALNKGKCAVYLKRDGWYMMPQLPEAEGEFVLLVSSKSEKYGIQVHKAPTYVWRRIDGSWNYSDIWKKAIAWKPEEPIPDWAPEVAAEE